MSGNNMNETKQEWPLMENMPQEADFPIIVRWENGRDEIFHTKEIFYGHIRNAPYPWPWCRYRPAMAAPTDWRSLPVTEFPALVQWGDGVCLIVTSSEHLNELAHHSIIRWQPWTNPPGPKRDPFKEWCIDNGYTPSALSEPRYRACWYAAEGHAIAAERARFAEGVEKVIQRYQSGSLGDYVFVDAASDLRALARGEGGTT